MFSITVGRGEFEKKDLLIRFRNLNGVLDASQSELESTPGMGKHSTALVKLVKEMCGMYLRSQLAKRDLLADPQSVVQFATMKLSGLPHEAFMVIFTNTQNEVLAHEIMNEGTVDQVTVYPRRIVERALGHHSAGLIIVHNHPSGQTLPSDDDRRMTRSIKEAPTLLNIRLLDHIIVSQNGYFSFLEGGLI